MASQDYTSPPLFGALFGFTSGTLLQSPTDGILQVTTAAGTFGTLLLGQAGSTTGIKFVASNNILQVQKGDGTNSIQLQIGSVSGQSTITANQTNSTNQGLYLGASTAGSGIVYSGTLGVSYLVGSDGTTATQGYVIQGVYTVPKTSNYTLLVADSGTHFTTTGAAGAVQFTLPTARIGLHYKFTCTAAQTMTVVGAAGTIAVSNNGTRGVTLTTLAANIYSSYELVCYDGTNWVRRANDGTTTLT